MIALYSYYTHHITNKPVVNIKTDTQVLSNLLFKSFTSRLSISSGSIYMQEICCLYGIIHWSTWHISIITKSAHILHCLGISLDGNNRNKQKMHTGRRYLLNWRTSGTGRRGKFNEGSACLWNMASVWLDDRASKCTFICNTKYHPITSIRQVTYIQRTGFDSNWTYSRI
jgi:hypothetical protein